MSQPTVNLQIPIDILVDAVLSLDLSEKRRLIKLLEAQIARTDEIPVDRDASQEAGIQEARAAFESGDFRTLDEYLARHSGKSE